MSKITYWVAINKETLEPVAVSVTFDDLPNKGHWLVQSVFNTKEYDIGVENE